MWEEIYPNTLKPNQVLESGALLYGHKSLELVIHGVLWYWYGVVLVEQAELCMLPK